MFCHTFLRRGVFGHCLTEALSTSFVVRSIRSTMGFEADAAGAAHSSPVLLDVLLENLARTWFDFRSTVQRDRAWLWKDKWSLAGVSK